jgi:colicin import membrane protein
MGLALVVHALLIAALTWGVSWKKDDPTATFEAELWSRLPQQAAPRAVEPPPPPPPPPEPEPAPRPEPAPPPQPAPPPPERNEAQIAVEQAKKKAEAEKKAREEAARKAAERKEAEKKLAEKRAAEKKAAEAKAKAEAERKERLAKAEAEKRERERQLAEERRAATEKAMRDEQMRRITGQAGATGGPNATGTAQQSSGPSPGYAGRVAARIRPNVIFTEPAGGNPRAEVEIRTLPDGTITASRLVKSSGNRAWDEAALRAIERTGSLPRDTDGRVPSSLIIGLRPLD